MRQPPTDLKDFIFISAFGLLLLILFSVYIWEGTYPFSFAQDLDTQFYLYSFFTTDSYFSGYFPLWTPHIYCGMPFLGFGHTSTLYPFLFFFRIMSFGLAHLVSLMFHLFIYGSFFYLLFRALHWRREVSFFMAVVMCMSGYYIRMHNFQPTILALAWAPAVLLALVKLGERVTFGRIMALVGFTSLAVLGGDVESLSHLFVISTVGILAGAWGFRNRVQGLAVWGLAMTVAFLLVAAQMLPMAEFSSQNLRSMGITYEYFTYGYDIRALAVLLINLVVPYLRWLIQFELGGLESFEALPFIPFVAVMLGIAGITRIRKERDVKFWLILLIYTCAVMAIATPPIGWIFYHIPVLNKFIRPYRIMYLFQLAWILLAGCGLRYFDGKSGKKLLITLVIGTSAQAVIQLITYPRPELYIMILSPLLLLAGYKWLDNKRFAYAVIAAILCVDVIFPTPWRDLARNKEDIFKPHESYAYIFSNIKKLSRTVNLRVYPGRAMPVIPQQAGFHFGTQTFEGWLTLPLYRTSRLLHLMDERAIEIKNGKLNKSKIFYILKDGKLIKPENMHLLNMMNLSFYSCPECNLKVSSPYTIDMMDVPEDRHLVYIEPGAYLEVETDLADTSTMGVILAHPEFKIDFVENEDQNKRWNLFKFQPTARGIQKHRIDLSPIVGKTGNLIFSKTSTANLATSWKSAEIHNPNKPFQRVFKGEWELYRNEGALPRAFIVHRSAVADNIEQALVMMKDPRRFNPATTVILERQFAETRGNLSDPIMPVPAIMGETIDIISYEPQVVKINAALWAPGYLFISDTYYPGWRAFDGEMELPIQPADVNFRAILLQPGNHEIEMIYKPFSFKIGLWTTLATLLSLCMVTILFLKKSGPKPKKGGN